MIEKAKDLSCCAFKIRLYQNFMNRDAFKRCSFNLGIFQTGSDPPTPRPTEEGALNCHKQTENIHTDNHCDSMTESARWADAVKSLHANKLR